MKNNYKKGQAALEFLTTYGWAFLVILVMIGALAYFGVLDPSNFVADRCVMGNPLTCEGQNYIINPGQALIQVRNGLNQNLNITSVEFLSNQVDDYTECDNNNWTVDSQGVSTEPANLINRDSSARILCEFGSDTLSAGVKERVQLRIRYHTGDAAFTRTISGELYTNVESE